jgi:hypothetical protein
MSKLLILISAVSAVSLACSDHESLPQRYTAVGINAPPVSIAGNNTTKAGPTTSVSGGPNTLGVAIPTATAVVGRIENGLEGKALSTSGNFSRALAQVKTNLPKVSNVNNATGYDQVQLLAYAACSDMTGQMQTMYGISASNSIASNQAALIAAGIRILDKHAAGLASAGPGAAQVTTVLTNLVQTEAADASNTSTIAFMAVCIAASTAGATMLGI